MNKSITLSLPYNLSKQQWIKVDRVYKNMYSWKGYDDNKCPTWFGTETENQYLYASVEPSGLIVSGKIPDDIWVGWLIVLCSKLSLVLNMEICDVEI